MSDPCNHPDPPETCFMCSAEPVVTVNDRGACAEHLDDVFHEAGAPLRLLLDAAEEAFNSG